MQNSPRFKNETLLIMFGSLLVGLATLVVSPLLTRNVLFLAHDEKQMDKSFSLYPANWILLANVDRRIGGDQRWNALIKEKTISGNEFLGFRRFKEFQGHTLHVVLFRRSQMRGS